MTAGLGCCNKADKMPHVVRAEAALLKIWVMNLRFFLLILDIQVKLPNFLYLSHIQRERQPEHMFPTYSFTEAQNSSSSKFVTRKTTLTSDVKHILEKYTTLTQ